MTYGTEYQEKVENVMEQVHGRLLKRLGWKKKRNESSIDTLLRSQAIAVLGGIGHEPTVKRCKKLFAGQVRGRKIVSDLRSAVYGVVAHNGSSKEFNKIKSMYEKETNPEEKNRLLFTLARFSKKELAMKALAYSLTDKVATQNKYGIPFVIAMNPETRDVLWKWTTDRWDKFMKYYSPGTKMLNRFVENFSFMSKESEKRQLEKFFSVKERRRDDIERGISQTLERVTVNIRFMKKNGLL